MIRYRLRAIAQRRPASKLFTRHAPALRCARGRGIARGQAFSLCKWGEPCWSEPRRILGMRLFDIARIAALISCAALLAGCPKKDTEAAPEPGQPAAQNPASDKAGAEPPAPAAPPAAPPAAAAPAAAAPAAAPAAAKKKADDDKGGW